jgi:DNA-binding transcriptional ArsR family regulator
MESPAKDQGSALADRLAGLEASLLDHPLRARIAAELAKQPLDPKQLADVLHEDLPRVSYHWRVLNKAGAHWGWSSTAR